MDNIGYKLQFMVLQLSETPNMKALNLVDNPLSRVTEKGQDSDQKNTNKFNSERLKNKVKLELLSHRLDLNLIVVLWYDPKQLFTLINPPISLKYNNSSKEGWVKISL